MNIFILHSISFLMKIIITTMFPLASLLVITTQIILTEPLLTISIFLKFFAYQENTIDYIFSIVPYIELLPILYSTFFSQKTLVSIILQGFINNLGIITPYHAQFIFPELIYSIKNHGQMDLIVII